MLSHEDNDLLTRTGAGTPMGELMRRYWVPAVLSKQIAKPDSPPVRVQVMGEKLVAFRDSEGRVGILDEQCPHRTASLYYGRNEECGLRCVYHGWKFDVDGNCTDLPSEPPGSNFQSKVRINAYPSFERGGLIWTYLGPPDKQPDFPDLIWTQIPDENLYVTRRIQDCNWLQAFEGGFDTSHLAFLHTGTADANRRVVPSYYPIVPVEGGFIAGTGRDVKEGETLWASNLMFMPFHKVFATSPEAAHVWVPIDDETTMLYSADYWVDRPLSEEDLKRTTDYHGIHTENIPGTDRAVQNKDNDYLIDRVLQASGKSYTGMRGLGVQDSAIQESMGPIADRTKEHLGVSDTAIIQIRKLLMQSLRDIAEGKEPPGIDPASYRVRSTRFALPRGASFEDEIARQLENPEILDFTQLGSSPRNPADYQLARGDR
jgi:phenylpropionate dioxygenase-like ring-hydroxylating dioxygenase large terminal subunit